jgi:long-chain acyl-CoA synthetase
MVQGYVGDADATRRHFDGGWFYPGDLVRQLPGGALSVLGRKDDMMILNGINIFPSEVERVLESFPGVRHAVCFPLGSPVHGEIPVAAVELTRPDAATPDALASFARGQLGVRSPRKIVVMDELPRNAQGKIVKRDLARHFRSGGPA